MAARKESTQADIERDIIREDIIRDRHFLREKR